MHGKRAISSLLQCQISLKVTLINLISGDGETLYLLRYDQLFKVSEYLAEQLQITDCKMIFYVFLNSMGPLARRWVCCNFFCKQVQTVPNIFLSPKRVLLQHVSLYINPSLPYVRNCCRSTKISKVTKDPSRPKLRLLLPL